MKTEHKDYSVVLVGPAGMGIQTVEQALVKILKSAGYHIFATKEYMSRVRGGMNSTSLRVGAVPVSAPVERIDLLLALAPGGVDHVSERISSSTVILGEKEQFEQEIPAGIRMIDVSFERIASAIGNKLYSNTVAVGLLGAVFHVEEAILEDFVLKRFAGKEQKVVEENKKAIQAGFEQGLRLVQSGLLDIRLQPDQRVKNQIVMEGIEAVGFGALAGGCNFIGAYPMSPSTGLLTFLAKHGKRFGVVVEQAEDEIAAIHMALGAWYAGARGIASTSGGGFALMTEGFSLAGMLESPLVIHLAQRPGPATGLPTRTEQADLDLALYAGHGEFPRAILAPGNLQQAFELTRHAFDLADRCQVPVFVLTDQYLADTYYNTEPFDLSDIRVNHHFVETQEGYLRFALTESGLSPRGIPGFGRGFVAVDSDEHDEFGRITEDLNFRTRMVEKRRGKEKFLIEQAMAPTVWPSPKKEHLVVCWGSTLPIVQEALEVLGREDAGLVHFLQVFPLHPSTAEILAQARTRICLEGNAGGQFARLLKAYADVEITHRILKYNGAAFTVEEIVRRLKEILK